MPLEDTPKFQDRGIRARSIIALGRQDVLTAGLKSEHSLEIIGSSSDHIIIDSENYPLQVGDEVTFGIDYSGLLSAMTSPFVGKEFLVDRQRVMNRKSLSIAEALL